MAEKNNILGSLLGVIEENAPSLVQKYAFGKTVADNNAVLNERITMNALNSSGPNDAAAAREQPLTFDQQIFGKKEVQAKDINQTLGIGLIIAGAAFAVFLFMRH